MKKSKRSQAPIEGRAYILGDYIDCDAIIPVRYCVQPTSEILGRLCFTAIDPLFPFRAKDGLVIVAGKQFGLGSANENAVLALKICDVKAIVAKSFAGIFQRNAINLGLPVFECAELSDETETDDVITIDVDGWTVANVNAGLDFPLEPMPKLVKAVLLAGGLIEYLKANPV